MDILDDLMEKYGDSWSQSNVSRKRDQKSKQPTKPYERVEALKKHLLRCEEREKRAHQVVENLLKPGISEDFMLSEVRHIAQNHFEDITEERAYVENLCGYPPCHKCLGSIPKQDYKISGRLRAILNIKERKKYCSSHCYRSAEFIKQQLDTSPVWLRDENDFEGRLKPYKLRIYDEFRDKNAVPRLAEKFNVTVDDLEMEPEKPMTTVKRTAKNRLMSACNSVRMKEMMNYVDSDDDEDVENPREWMDEVWKAFSEWFTIASGAHLFGGRDRFFEFLRKTCRNEVELRQLEDEVTIISFNQLSLEKKLENHPEAPSVTPEALAKIRAFYSGNLYECDLDPCNLENTLDSDTVPVMVPVLPEKNPSFARRQIFCDKVAKNGMVDFCGNLKISWIAVVPELSALAQTLNLTSANVCLQARQWEYVALILMRLLKERSSDLREAWDACEASSKIRFTIENFTFGTEDILEVDRQIAKGMRKCLLKDS
ncbi:unnamed protein product [Notodromas monacha]|uniref:RNA polymerase II subunit B1 CTD phosphatase RPAP2 homolog n=1 Tax=Notodromas monacha TaxID=399045 RepID=A0A7R9GJ23_9CRUS|nr:unnamed protein product [Notodromas monacha]CAG0922416.1 unnamed protein product [Notodromas monacha]